VRAGGQGGPAGGVVDLGANSCELRAITKNGILSFRAEEGEEGGEHGFIGRRLRLCTTDADMRRFILMIRMGLMLLRIHSTDVR